MDYKKFSDCLSVRIDSKVSWKPQIVESCKRYNKKIKMLRHLKFLPKEALEAIYFKTVIPCVTYGIAVWGSWSSSLIDDLESIHIRAARVIRNIPKRVKKHDILSYVGWQSLKYFYSKRLLTLAHSAFYGSGISEINSLIEKEHTNYNLRSSLRLIVDRQKQKLVESRFNTELPLHGIQYLTK